MLPATQVQRARLGALGFAVLSILPLIPQIDPAHPPVRRITAALALLALIADYIVTYRRGRVLRLDWLVVGVATVAAGTALLDPVATTALCVSTLAMQSQFGSAWATWARLAALAVAFPVTIAISPMSLGRHIDWYSGAILSLIPHLLMITVMVRVLHAALAVQQVAVNRETLVAQAGRELIHRTDLPAVRAIAAQTAEALCALSPGTAMIVLRREGDTAVVDSVAGVPAAAVDQPVPASVVAGVEAVDGSVGSLDASAAGPLNALAGRRLRWRGVLVAGVGAEVVLVVGAARAPADAAVEAFRALITQRSLAEANCAAHAELAYRAHTDQLTALPNRARFFQRLAAAVDAARGTEDRVALLLIDLDDFKLVNDVYGHAAGDQLLVEIAARLAETAGADAVAARFGGDEFAVLLSGQDGQDGVDRLADRIRERLREPVRLTPATVRVGASIGIAAGAPRLTAADLMRCADIAMYGAKAKGKNRVQRFTTAEHGDLAQLRLMEDHLAHAVDRGEIAVCYEPMIDPASGRCAAVEAVMRWQHGSLGTLLPHDFLPIAERTGEIVRIGAHVLRTACAELASWPAGDRPGGLRLAVTVSPHQLNEAAFATMVRDILAEHGIAPRRLTLQIADLEPFTGGPCAAALADLTGHGVRVALDDFGLGSVTLASLESHPVNQIKVSSRPAADADASPMFEMALSIGKILGIETVATNVQTAAQAATAQAAGTSLAQGAWFAAAMTGKAFVAWLAVREMPVPDGLLQSRA